MMTVDAGGRDQGCVVIGSLAEKRIESFLTAAGMIENQQVHRTQHVFAYVEQDRDVVRIFQVGFVSNCAAARTSDFIGNRFG